MSNQQFYVRLFSTSSQHIYPLNTKTAFTCHLPHPIELHGTWEVGLVEFFHDKIIGVKSDSEKQISFSKLQDGVELDSYSLQEILRLQGTNWKYAKDYWGKYYDESYYLYDGSNSIWVDYNKDVNGKKFRSNSDSKNVQKVVINITPDDWDEKNILTSKRNKIVVKLQKSIQYTVIELLKEYLFNIIDEFYLHKQDLVTEAIQDQPLNKQRKIAKNYDDNTKRPTNLNNLIKQYEKRLYFEALKFITPLQKDAERVKLSGSHYVAIYTDIIEPYINGNSLSKILYLSDRENDSKPLFVTNIQYHKIEKTLINAISIFIANDQGEQLLFGESNPSKPTALVLHFRQI